MQAIILAGGKGTRLGALAVERPKPLIDVGGKPFICYLIAALRRHGFDDVVLLVGPFGRAFEELLGDGTALGVKLTLVPFEKALTPRWLTTADSWWPAR